LVGARAAAAAAGRSAWGPAESQALGAKWGSADAPLRLPGSTLSPLVQLMVPGLSQLQALSHRTAGPISNAAVLDDMGQAAGSQAARGL